MDAESIDQKRRADAMARIAEDFRIRCRQQSVENGRLRHDLAQARGELGADAEEVGRTVEGLRAALEQIVDAKNALRLDDYRAVERWLNEHFLPAATAAEDALEQQCATCSGKGLVIQDAEWEPVAVRCPTCGGPEQSARKPCSLHGLTRQSICKECQRPR